jgi:hypothetical protein
MDFYLELLDEKLKQEDDNPAFGFDPIFILLASYSSLFYIDLQPNSFMKFKASQ